MSYNNIVDIIDETVRNIMQHPTAYIISQNLHDRLAQERQNRQRFYEQIEENKKMEFINGEIYFHSPVMLRHNKATGLLYRLLSTYVDKHTLGYIGIEKILISLTRNDYEPDICFFSNEKAQHFTPTQRQFPTPDFVVEVLSNSTEHHDRQIKWEDYAAHGIAEYWIVDPDEQIVEQYLLSPHATTYHLHLKVQQGTISSTVIKGFTIPVTAIFDETDNMAALVELLK